MSTFLVLSAARGTYRWFLVFKSIWIRNDVQKHKWICWVCFMFIPYCSFVFIINWWLLLMLEITYNTFIFFSVLIIAYFVWLSSSTIRANVSLVFFLWFWIFIICFKTLFLTTLHRGIPMISVDFWHQIKYTTLTTMTLILVPNLTNRITECWI